METKDILEIINKIKLKEDYTVPQTTSSNFLQDSFKNIIRDRINHCTSELEKWKDDPKTYSICSEVICFPNGKHFSFPVYRKLKEALCLPMKSWERIIWQQIIRQMYITEYKNIELFRYATEALLIL